ncbi:MAG: tetratricopeptide repeat protein, partial [Prosthecobacter sp.]|nr:tetratricopeptide repeat protein [Prosthecobacter sp.]
RRVIEDGEDEADTWIGLGNLLSGHLKRYDEAENAYRTAIDKFNEPVAWTMLGVMMMRYLNRLTDAEAAYRKALEIDPKLGLAWFNIGTLYALHFGRGADALEANERAVQFDPANAGYWNGLGNVKFDYLNDLDSAEAAFRKALELDPNEDAPRYNLAFLLRDYRLDFKAARSVLAEIKQPDRWKDSRILQAALFAAYEENWGQATDSLREALAELGDGGLPPNSQDDWFRASAVLLNLGYGEAFIEFLRAERSDICLLPWFSAVEAHQVGDRQMLLNIPTEARETAEFVFDQIAKRRANLPKRPKSET